LTEDRVRELLRDRPAPDEAAAQERGWRVVGKAFAEREPARHRRRPRPLVVALTAALALLVAGLTPPGQAVADWLRDAVKPGREDARDALVSLPARGRLIVTSQRGPWIVERDGSKRLLGAFDDASWSPRGLFVVVTRGHEVIALEPGGRPRWSLARPSRVRAARWSPDGFRIAYHAGDDLRIVAGDGTGDRPLVRGVAAAPSAWWPGPAHRLAYAQPGGRVAVVDGDSGTVLWRSARADGVTRLAWSSDGTRLLAVSPRAVRQFDVDGNLLGRLEMAAGTTASTAAFRPAAREFALVSKVAAGDRSRLEVVRMEGGTAPRRLLLAGAGRFGDVAWAPDGEWLLVGWEDADQWVFVRTGARVRPTIERLRAVGNISRQFDPGGSGRAEFPGLGEWCCPPVGRPK
jgi:dipeptidyl aminopeptidase/acylaminoacyl peptidase